MILRCLYQITAVMGTNTITIPGSVPFLGATPGGPTLATSNIITPRIMRLIGISSVTTAHAAGERLQLDYTQTDVDGAPGSANIVLGRWELADFAANQRIPILGMGFSRLILAAGGGEQFAGLASPQFFYVDAFNRIFLHLVGAAAGDTWTTQILWTELAAPAAARSS